MPAAGSWATGNRTTGIRPGDRVFLLRQGTQDRGLIGSGEAVDHLGNTGPDGEIIYTDTHWDGSGAQANYVGRVESVLEWAEEHGVTYVVAAAESGMELCETLRAGLPGVPANDPDDPARRWDKEHMFDALAASHVPSLRTTAVTSTREVGAEMLEYFDQGHEFVVKPSIGAGSVDVRLVRNEDELKAAIGAIVDGTGFFGDKPKALIQQAFPQPYHEYVIDTFTSDGRHEIIAVSVYGKHTSIDGDFVYDEIRWLPPSDPAVAELAEYTGLVLDALGVRIGPSHIEVMAGPACGPRLIDFGARPHGAGHPAKTFHLTGNSQIHRECEYIAGTEHGAKMYSLQRQGAIVFFNTSQRSICDGSVDSDDLAAQPGVIEAAVNATESSIHESTRSLLDALALGLAFVEAEDTAELAGRCRTVRTRFADSLVPTEHHTQPATGR